MKRSTWAWLATCLLLLMTEAVAAAEAPAADPWPVLRQHLFGERAIEDGTAVLQLDVPTRAENAAVVPVAVHATFAQSAQRHIKTLHLVIDHNPAPVAGVFHFTLDSGRADIETRVRIAEHSQVRAIAELEDGRLYMVSRFVKAAGGCSAPASTDPTEAKARLGKMRLRIAESAPGQPNRAQLMISHPNDSGLVMDQVSRLYVPAHFVRSVTVNYGGKPVLSAELSISMSENPNIRFYFNGGKEGELSAQATDSTERMFSTKLAVPAAIP